MPLLVAFLLLAQSMVVRGYTTPDPINVDRLGIALPSGRYMVSLEEGDACAAITVGQNLWVAQDDAQHWLLQPLERADTCSAFVWGRRDDARCEVDMDGQCDATNDPPYPPGY